MLGLKIQKPLVDDIITRYEEKTKVNSKGEKEVYPERVIVQNDSPNTYKKYSQCARWCNENNAMIKDVGDYYVVVPVPKPTKEELASRVRSKRDALISETDYLLAPDYPISPEDLALVKTYRQELRNVPQQEGFPEKVTFPELPKVLRKDSTGLSLATVGI